MVIDQREINGYFFYKVDTINDRELLLTKGINVDLLEIEISKEIKIKELNKKRNLELDNLVISNILCSEDQIKTMFIEYITTTANDTISWIDISNNLVEFNRDEFYEIIKKAKLKVKEIYFLYRTLKDGVLNGIT